MSSPAPNSQPASNERAARRRPAFTLLEVVFALALAVLLMAALLSSVRLYREVSTTGRDEVARAQLARAILRQMEKDLRACRFSEDEGGATSSASGSGTGGGSGSGSGDGSGGENSEEEMTTVTAEDAAAAYAGQSIGVMGDSTTLLVHLSRPPRPIDAFRQTGGPVIGETTSDLRSVAYFMATPAASGLAGAAAEVLTSVGATANESGSLGLARLEGDPLSLEALDESSNVEAMLASTQLLATEVDYLAFRYFDGTDWYDSWDSVSQASLPTAVEITLRVNTGSDDADAEVFRLVVAPAATVPTDANTTASSF